MIPRSHRELRRGPLLALLAVLALALAGCTRQGPPFALKNVTGLLPRLEFALTNHNGERVTAATYLGKVVLLYFGYTNCPDACPTTLATLATAIRSLGPGASDVRVLFVTVDPHRDTAAVLKNYVSFFGPQFVGLRGDPSELAAITKRYRVAYHLESPGPDGQYAVDHSSAIFIFDRTGRARLLGSETDHSRPIASDLTRLLAS
jgi:protein SCO1